MPKVLVRHERHARQSDAQRMWSRRQARTEVVEDERAVEVGFMCNRMFDCGVWSTVVSDARRSVGHFGPDRLSHCAHANASAEQSPTVFRIGKSNARWENHTARVALAVCANEGQHQRCTPTFSGHARALACWSAHAMLDNCSSEAIRPTLAGFARCTRASVTNGWRRR